MSNFSMHLLVCGGSSCKSSDSDILVEKLRDELSKQGLEEKVQVIMTGCFGFCEKGPIVKVMPDNLFYTQVSPNDAEDIIKEHVVKGQRVERLIYHDPKHSTKNMVLYKKVA